MADRDQSALRRAAAAGDADAKRRLIRVQARTGDARRRIEALVEQGVAISEWLQRSGRSQHRHASVNGVSSYWAMDRELWDEAVARFAEFIVREGVRKESSAKACPTSVIGKRCRASGAYYSRSASDQCPCRLFAFDHTKVYLTTGQRKILVTQPYYLEPDLSRIQPWCEENRVEVEVSVERSFYYPNSSSLVLFRKG